MRYCISPGLKWLIWLAGKEMKGKRGEAFVRQLRLWDTRSITRDEWNPSFVSDARRWARDYMNFKRVLLMKFIDFWPCFSVFINLCTLMHVPNYAEVYIHAYRHINNIRMTFLWLQKRATLKSLGTTSWFWRGSRPCLNARQQDGTLSPV